MKEERINNMCGGEGYVTIRHLLSDHEQSLNKKITLYAQVTIEPGHSLGYHEHHGESEIYYIISGKGEYSDDGSLRPVSAGDLTFTPDGHGHGMANCGEENLVFTALIVAD